MDKEVGLVDNDDVLQVGCLEYFQEDKDPEICNYWTTDFSKEVCAEIEMHINHLQQNMEDIDIPVLDYTFPWNKNGCTVLFGGDHGDGCF